MSVINYKEKLGKTYLSLFFLIFLAVSTSASGTEHIEGGIKWPLNGSANVTETAIKNGNSLKYQYELFIQDLSDGLRKVSYKNYALISAQGKRLSTEEVESLNEKFASSMEVPEFTIDANGYIVEIIDFESIINASAERYIKKKGLTGEEANKFLDDYSSKIRGINEIIYTKRWNQWGIELGENNIILDKPFRVSSNREIMGFPFEFDNIITISEGPEEKTYSITRKVSMGKEEILKSMNKYLENEPAFNKGKTPEDYIEDLKQNVDVRLVISSEGMRLLNASVEVEYLIKPIGKPAINSMEKNEYIFDWRDIQKHE